MWHEWFTFSRQDRRAVLLLSVLVCIALLLLWAKPVWHCGNQFEIHTPDSLLSTLNGTPQKSETIQIVPFPFDPNTADSLELLAVGLSPRVAQNILRYRRAGGVFRRADDLVRIYGLHDTVFTRIKPYITIPDIKKAIINQNNSSANAHNDFYEQNEYYIPHPSSYEVHRRPKYKPGKFVDLNTADTTELMKIPGIGSIRAQRIVEYRHKLGGYHSISQVHEACELPELLGDWVHISAPMIDKLNVNFASMEQLQAHPYITPRQARAIMNLRHREGNIKSMRQLLFMDEFTEADIARLTPYLSLE